MDSLPNLSLSLIAYPSIRSSRLSHITVQSRKISSTVPLPNREQIADRRLLCRIHLKKSFPSTKRTPHRAGPTSQTPYQILVLTTIDGELNQASVQQDQDQSPEEPKSCVGVESEEGKHRFHLTPFIN
jgi:hypothetical protein